MDASICWDVSSPTRLWVSFCLQSYVRWGSHCARPTYFPSICIPISRLVVSTVRYFSPISCVYIAHPNSFFPPRGDIAIIRLHLYHIGSSRFGLDLDILIILSRTSSVSRYHWYFVVYRFFRDNLCSLGNTTSLQRRSRSYFYYNLLFF